MMLDILCFSVCLNDLDKLLTFDEIKNACIFNVFFFFPCVPTAPSSPWATVICVKTVDL